MKINRLKIVLANGYNVKVDPSAGNTDPSIKVFFIPTDDLTILLFFLRLSSLLWKAFHNKGESYRMQNRETFLDK